MEGLRPRYTGAVFVTPEYPWPSTSGGRVRAANIAVALRELGPLTVLSLDGGTSDDRWLVGADRHRARRKSLLSRAKDVTTGLLAGRHVVLVRAERAGLPEALATIVAETRPSVVILGRPLFGAFVPAARAASAMVVGEIDESQNKVSSSLLRSSAPVGRRFRALLDLLSAGRMEHTELPRLDQLWVSSRAEVDAVRQDAGPAPIAVIPNVTSGLGDRPRSAPALQAIGFVGYFGHPPNEAAALELMRTIMPAIRAAGGPRRLVLIGREPTARMRRAASRDPDVTITGTVPDPASNLRDAGVLVMPVRAGAGTRLKAIEAVAAGVPIVSTAFGVEGLPLRPGRDFLIAETPAEFGLALDRLADDGTRDALVHCAFDALVAENSPEALRDALHSAVAELLPAPARAAHTGRQDAEPDSTAH